MGAPWNPPIRGQDYVTDICLADMAANGRYKSTPTIAAGDFKVSKDGGALANLNTLPSVLPAGSKIVAILLSATEMTADRVTVICSDQTVPPEWADYSFTILTT